MSEDISLLEFPCEIQVKVFGETSDLFIFEVEKIFKSFYGLGGYKVSQRDSANKKFMALSITVNAQSRDQIDEVYRHLAKCRHVKLAL
jgi:putative lipoic acid-binding regulatory protein